MKERETILLTSQLAGCRLEYMVQTGYLRGKKDSPLYHDHSVWEIHCVLSGSVKLYYEDKEYVFSRNDVFLIPPGRLHCLYETDRTERMGFRFSYSPAPGPEDPGIMLRYLKRVFPTASPADTFRSFSSAECCGTMSRILREYPEHISDYLAARLSEEVVMTAAEHIRPIPSTAYAMRNRETDSIRIVRTEDFLNENYNRKVRLSELAALYCLSEKQTERTVLRLFGKTFSAMVSEKRLTVACFFLRHTGMSMEEIAETAGFGAVRYFYRCFRSAYGMTPGAYRAADRSEKVGQTE